MLNLQGDIEKIYDATGEVVVTYIYDAWGKLISIEDDTTNNIGTKNPLRYRGYYYDTETGFYYLQSRYYDPEICRFINADSLIIAGNDYIQGTNRYAYCYNNPVTYVDPTGYAGDDIINSSTQLAIDITTFFVGAYLFEEICKDFGIDGIGKLESVLGKIVDMEYEVYEFEVSDIFETATDYSTDITVSGAIELLMKKIFSKIKLSSITNLIVSTTLSSVVYAFLEEIELKSGNYTLVHFSFLETRESRPLGDWFVHDFFFLYYQSNDKDYIGNLLDEVLSPYNFWYSFIEM